MASMSARAGAQALAKYGMAAQAEFHGQDMCHIALDSSTVGKKPITFALMTLPTNIGVICPPLVHSTNITSTFSPKHQHPSPVFVSPAHFLPRCS